MLRDQAHGYPWRRLRRTTPVAGEGVPQRATARHQAEFYSPGGTYGTSQPPQFLTTTAGLAGILATGMPPARGQQREISYLCWNNFAPASDKKLAEIGQRFTKDTGIKIKIDHIARTGPAGRQVRLRGPDPGRARPRRDAHALPVALRAAARGRLRRGGRAREEVRQGHPLRVRGGPRQRRVAGGARSTTACSWPPTARTSSRRPSLKVPDTWEDLYTVGKELKKMGNPVGIPISQNYDSISTAGPVLWSLRRHGGGQGRQDRPDQLARHRADDRVVQEDVPRLHGARGAVLVRRQQQRVDPAGQGGLDPQPGQRLHRGQQQQAASPPTASTTTGAWPGPAAATRRTRRATSASGSSRRTSSRQGVDPLPARQAGGLRRVHHVRRRLQPARLREAPGPSGAQDRSRSSPPSRARACSTTPTAGRRRPVGQGPAHHQHLSSAQHDRQGGHRHLDQGRRSPGPRTR